jgi:hypothetical protein
MRRNSKLKITLLLLSALTVASTLAGPGGPGDGKPGKKTPAQKHAAVQARIQRAHDAIENAKAKALEARNRFSFMALEGYHAFRAAMISAVGFYAEARDNEAKLDSSDAMEAMAYTTSTNLAAVSSENKTALAFNRACEPGRHVTIGAVGDVLLHQPLAVQGFARTNHFQSLWSDLEPYLEKPDFMYANLEGPTAGAISTDGRAVTDPGNHFDHVAYTSYPLFNYSPELVPDLKASGIDIVSTANNHAMDRHWVGADRTIENLVKSDMPFSGTRTSDEAKKTSPADTNWTTTTEKNGFKIGWVACSFSTNGNTDSYHQVLLCFEQRAIVLDQIRKLKADPSIDAVIATPHWGIEYDQIPGADQKKLAQDMVDAGAMIVFGNHPHVLQPVDKLVAKDGHEGYVIYSLGNFVSGQKGVAKRASAIIYVGLTKNEKGEVFVNGTRHLPLAMMYGNDGLMVKPAKGNFEEARTLANAVLARSREVTPEDPLVTNPDCP